MVGRSLVSFDGENSGGSRRSSRQLWVIALLGTAMAALFVFRSLDSKRAAVEQARHGAPHSAAIHAVTARTMHAPRTPAGARDLRPTAEAAEQHAAIAEPAASAAQVVPAEPTAQDYIDHARAEPRDEAWANAMERTFGEDLGNKAKQQNFRLGRIECFATSCTAELFWDTLREARAGLKGALGGPDHTRCSPRLLLSREGNENAAEMGVMVLDCKAERERAAIRAGTTTH